MARSASYHCKHRKPERTASYIQWDRKWPSFHRNRFTVCSYHVTYTFQSESTLCSCLNVKELLAWNWREIWSLSDCNRTRTHNHLVCKWTLNHLAKAAKWLSCVVSTCLYDAFDCMFLSSGGRYSFYILMVYVCISNYANAYLVSVVSFISNSKT